MTTTAEALSAQAVKLPPEERIRNFNEFHVPLHTDEQQAQGTADAELQQAMAQADLSRINPALLLKYSALPRLDPYSMPASASMALLQELMATASVVGTC